MLQYRTRAGVLPNPCNCGLLEKLGLLDDFTLGAFPFCLKTHVANFQRCRPAFAEAASRRQLQGFFSTPARFRYRFFGTGEKILFINRNRVVWASGL